jgi:hypothetical protein
VELTGLPEPTDWPGMERKYLSGGYVRTHLSSIVYLPSRLCYHNQVIPHTLGPRAELLHLPPCPT